MATEYDCHSLYLTGIYAPSVLLPPPESMSGFFDPMHQPIATTIATPSRMQEARTSTTFHIDVTTYDI